MYKTSPKFQCYVSNRLDTAIGAIACLIKTLVLDIQFGINEFYHNLTCLLRGNMQFVLLGGMEGIRIFITLEKNSKSYI